LGKGNLGKFPKRRDSPPKKVKLGPKPEKFGGKLRPRRFLNWLNFPLFIKVCEIKGVGGTNTFKPHLGKGGGIKFPRWRGPKY